MNGPYGLQQGFTLDARPLDPPGRQGTLTMLLALDGGLQPAVDADGNQCPARLELQAGNLAILVDDTAARYPLTIDPVFQAAKLTTNDAADRVTDIFFGSAVAISGDTMVVGAPRYDTNGNESGGAAYLFIRQAAGYAEWGRYFQLKMYSSPGDNFGRAVAVSGDTVVVGSPNHGDQGAAYVFVKSGTYWASSFPAATLTAGDGAAGDNFGSSVALNGSLAVVGAYPLDSNGPGAAYVFQGL